MYNENKDNEGVMKRYGLSVSLTREENDMAEALRKAPHYINMSEFIRDAIRKLFLEKVKNEKTKEVQNK